MATYASDYFAQVLATSSLHTRPNQNTVQRKLKNFDHTYTPAATEASGEYIRLGRLWTPGAIIIPELIRIRHGATTSFSKLIRFVKATTVDGTRDNGRLMDATWSRSSTTCTV